MAIVTGAAMGVGEETAQLFAPAGAKVVLADFNVEAGEKVAQSLVEAVGKAAFSRIGLSNSDHVKLMVVFAVKRFGRLDATVNNATLGPDNSPAAVLDEACWETAGEGCLSGPSPPPLFTYIIGYAPP